MVQIFNPQAVPSKYGQLGQQLSQGLARNFPTPETLVQEKRLSQAFQNLENLENPNYQQQMSAIAPTLLSTPGGSEALSYIAPILAKQAQNKAVKQNIEFRRQEGLGKQNLNLQPSQMPEEIKEGEQPTPIKEKPKFSNPEDKFRYAANAEDLESLYPQTTAGPQEQPLMSPQELDNYALNLMELSAETGQPITYPEALKYAQEKNNQTLQFNNQIKAERNAKKEAITQQGTGIVKRAESAGLVKQPEDSTVLEQLAYKHRNAKTPADQWEAVRTEFKDFERARQNIMRMSDLPGPFTKFYRKVTGTDKDFEQIQKDLQEPLNYYRKYGLFDEARNLLIGNLGMGTEDAEMTLFPPSKKEMKDLQNFSSGPDEELGKQIQSIPYFQQNLKYKVPPLNDENFTKFKDELGEFLAANPETNLIAMRGYLQRQKHYNWEDINKAIQQLEEERRFTPDLIQSQQLPVIQQAPVPGLAEQFQYWWKNTK